MNAHVLLNLLNQLGKRDAMWGLLSILSLFGNKFNKFNNTIQLNSNLFSNHITFDNEYMKSAHKNQGKTKICNKIRK